MAIAPARTVFDVITDFLASDPDPEAILAYRLPEALEQKAPDLLAHHQEGGLSFEEEQELYDFMRADDLMTLLKAKTRKRFAGGA